MTEPHVPRALVTGATGFVGAFLVDDLIRKGWEVHSLVRVGSHNDGKPNTGTRHTWDGSTDGLFRIVAAASPDTVFHLASLFLAQHRAGDVMPLIDTNVRFGTQLLEAMVAHGIPRIIYAGTSWQHFRNEEYNPVCLYAATKQAFADILRYYTESTPIRAVTLSLYDTFGPCDRRHKLFTQLRNAARDDAKLEMSPGEQLLDLVYIDDTVSAFQTAAALLRTNAIQANGEFAVSSGHPQSLRAVVATYCRVTGKQIEVAWGGKPYREREVMIPWNFGRPLPGWNARISLEEGIRRMESFA